jgi:hypothetical protein
MSTIWYAFRKALAALKAHKPSVVHFYAMRLTDLW